MLKIKTIHNTTFKPYEIEEVDIDIALKHYVLFTKDANDKILIALNPQKINESFGYLSKFDFSYEIIFLDEESYEKLYNQFLEIKTDKAI